MTSATRHPVELRYATASDVDTRPDASRVLLALEGSRGTVGVRGRVREPALFRDALAATLGILASDLRYRGRDRTAYLAYLMKQGKRATAQIWEAQKAFLDASLQTEEQKDTVLDPVLTVDPDQVSLEVFSRDESAYARLAFDSALFEGREAAHGSTFLDVPKDLMAKVDRLRTYVPLSLEAHVALPAQEARAPRNVEVPHAWLRGFLQVQSAATLPASTCTLAPIDLYNLLFALRTRKAKAAPRALRFELVPGAPPRLILEPWELVLECHASVYTGTVPAVVRTFGRQRLVALARLLPHAKSVRVRLLGPGLPVFWAVDLGEASLTMALTGWTESGWSSAAAFDVLMPRAVPEGLPERLRQRLRTEGPLPFEKLAAEAGAPKDAVRAALQLECLRGRILYDIAQETYRPRELMPAPVDEAALRYGNEREARAHRLLGDDGPGAGEVKLTKVHEVVGEGTRIHGEVVDREAVRSFFPSFTLDLEGRVREASCGCPHFRRSGLREGPCEHMMALRLVQVRHRAEQEALRQTPAGRQLIRAETRSYVRREPSGQEQVYRVSLDGKVVAVEWGPRQGESRRQKLWFDTDAEARTAYFTRLESLAAEGYIDAAASMM
ncbi:SWIM zinc finger family protein [Stigmatella aurantiaca]|uniref:SWIM Zinc finger domain protein n=1 Tax=Stigmatella aurantiaca (strain DW4/3-1) TaxID=378806 RepID=Q08MF7_STIAD|nr:SWIM zinc finger family protein [Stigmatella aurantiaca]ADO67965.1 SWIM zinc finger domain protein [Stigmatella aurantiaca DW4/3-1]EAU61664.1 swim zinc finger domain protein [Stigmatella aurantiaca DW4/3-1]